MAFLRWTRGSRLRRSTVLVTLAAAAVTVWLVVGAADPASARSLNGIKADIQEFNGNCGGDTGGDVIGTATFTRKGKTDMLNVEYRLTHGKPNTKYQVQLWENAPDYCTKLGDFGTIRTDAKGRASRQFKWGPIGSVTEVFADGYDFHAGNDNDSLSVSI